MFSAEMKDTLKTMIVATAGFGAQLTNWDIILKVMIGLVTLAFLAVKLVVFVAKNWKVIRHPIRYIQAHKGDTKKL